MVIQDERLRIDLGTRSLTKTGEYIPLPIPLSGLACVKGSLEMIHCFCPSSDFYAQKRSLWRREQFIETVTSTSSFTHINLEKAT